MESFSANSPAYDGMSEDWSEQASTMPRRLAALESIVRQQGLLLNYQQNALDDLKASNSKKDSIIEGHEAAVAELTATVEQLQRDGRKAKSKNLRDAADDGNVDEILGYLAEGADINARSHDGFTPLHCAAGNDRSDAVEVLLANGADIEALTRVGETSLELATNGGLLRVVKALLVNGASIEGVMDNGYTPLMHAIYQQEEEIVEVLLASGANVNAVDDDGLTPLMHAAVINCIPILKALIRRGAKLNERNNRGQTALTLALKKGFEDAVEILRAGGAHN